MSATAFTLPTHQSLNFIKGNDATVEATKTLAMAAIGPAIK